MKRKVIGRVSLIICASLYLASCYMDMGGNVSFKNEQKDTVYVSINLIDKSFQFENRERYHKAHWNDSRQAYMLPPDSIFVLFTWINGVDSSDIPFDAIKIFDEKNNQLLHLTNKTDIFSHLKFQDQTYVLK